jgi:Tol biopolymer transport system component
MKKLLAATAAALLTTLVLVVTADQQAANATSSGRNGRIAFNRGGDIYTVKSDGTGLKRLTRYGGGASNPQWSPNGNRLLYSYKDSVWVMQANGTGKKRVSKGWAASWAPDGKRIAYVYPDNAWVDPDNHSMCDPSQPDDFSSLYPAVVTQQISGGPRTVVYNYAYLECFDWGYYQIEYGPTTAWSADGGKIYFSFYDFDEEHGADGGDDHHFTGIGEIHLNGPDYAFTHYDDVWNLPPTIKPTVDTAPVSTNVVYTNEKDYRVTVENGSHTYKRVISSDGNATFPTFSPNRKYVLYTYHPPGGGYSIKRVTLPGSPTTKARTIIAKGSQPDWQPLR